MFRPGAPHGAILGVVVKTRGLFPRVPAGLGFKFRAKVGTRARVRVRTRVRTRVRVRDYCPGW